MGFAIGTAAVFVLILATRNANGPYVLGPVLQIAGAAAGASLGGWFVANIATAVKRRSFVRA